MNPVMVKAEFHVKPGQIDDFLTTMKNVVEPSRKEAGCLFYELYKSDDQENTYVVFERWKSHDDIRQHMVSEHVTETAKAIQPYLKDSFILEYFTALSE